MSPAEEAPLPDPDPSLESALDKREKKRLKKLQKALEDARRPLAAWERYRALSDAFEMEQDLVDLADHKARFALLIMGTLNAVTFIVGTRSETLGMLPLQARVWLSVYLGVYALLALYFFIQAIESLRPREAKPNVRYPGEAGLEDYPTGLRFFADVLLRDVYAYRAAWRSVHVGQLNAEVALQVHVLARINRAKFAALQRLYVGLKGMTLLTAALLTSLAFIAFSQPREGIALLQKKGGKAAASARPSARPAAQLLGEPERFAVSGAREPSGVAFHPASGHLFMVGDEGSLVELALDGTPLWSGAGFPNLEDVAVHTPSGRLLMLSEKKAQLILFDPVARREIRKFKLDKRALLGKEPSADPNQGFEGLGFREEPGRPGGGVFYLTHQRSPALVVAIAFDLEHHEKTLGEDAVVKRFKVEGFKDLTAVAYAPVLDRLLVVADHKDRLLVLTRDGELEEEVVLPGLQQEGVALDAVGDLWVADDRGGLLRFPGALQALRDHRATTGKLQEAQ